MKRTDVVKHIEANTPLRKGVDFFVEGPDHWGNYNKFGFGFWYSSKYFDGLIDMLEAIGLELTDIHVGSDVHGYMHRIVKFKNKS